MPFKGQASVAYKILNVLNGSCLQDRVFLFLALQALPTGGSDTVFNKRPQMFHHGLYLLTRPWSLRTPP